jgi:filamentous hemagglutinin family protein
VSQSFSSLVQILICILSCLSATTSLAQVNPDNTLDTQVETNGNVSEITGGQTRGSNLFHSFQDFSLQTGSEAFFNNANNISTIFSRVTGESISNIDGLIRANGSADLFLINPNGIIFGENAQLNIGGSFLGSTASSIVFADGEFSAIDVDSPPLLTINAPIGLALPDNPGAIVNRSRIEDSEANPVGLKVSAGNNFSLVGGEILFEGGNVTARGANVALGGLSQAGVVNLDENGSLTFPGDAAKANIALSSNAVVNVRSIGEGNITVNASNLDLTENSELRAGISADSTSSDAQAGDIEINLSDNLNLDNSNITNTLEAQGVGNSGNINIATGSIQATNGGQIDTNTFGKGNGGNINIATKGDITFDGENDNLESGVISLVLPGAEGDAGNITINTQGKLTLTNGGRVDASTSALGNGGNINITATGDITFDGEDLEQLGGGATSLVNPEAVGNAGNVTIYTGGNMTLTNRGRIEANDNGRGQGNGGNVTIDTGGNLTIDGEKNSKGFGSNIRSLVNTSVTGDSGNIVISTGGNLTVKNEGEVDASSSGEGDSGNITVSTKGNLTLSNEGQVDTTNNGKGDSGNIVISTGGNLTLSSGGKINTNINTQGNGGDITIDAVGDIIFEGDDPNGDGSGATSLVGEDGSGNAGNITISTQGKLSLTDGGRVDASSNRGQGNAGSVDLTATDDIIFEGEDSRGFGSGATSQANPGVEAGNSGGITISTQGNLTFTNGGRVDTSTNAQGNAGSVNINALGDITFEGKALNGDGSGVTSQVNPEAEGNAGVVAIFTQGNLTLKDGGRVDVSINSRENTFRTNADLNLQVAENLILDNSSLISAKASGNADGGNLDIDSRFIIAVPNGNSDIIASAEQGQGGNIDIETSSLFGIEERPLSNSTNDINASSQFGLSGTVEVEILEADPSPDSLEIPVEPVQAEVAQTCQVSSTGNQSEFVVTGRGGLPSEPEDNFRLPTIATDENTLESQASAQQFPTVSPPIVEATGWVRNARGKIVLVASPSSTSSLNSHSNLANCNS